MNPIFSSGGPIVPFSRMASLRGVVRDKMADCPDLRISTRSINRTHVKRWNGRAFTSFPSSNCLNSHTVPPCFAGHFDLFPFKWVKANPSRLSRDKDQSFNLSLNSRCSSACSACRSGKKLKISVRGHDHTGINKEKGRLTDYDTE